MKRFETPQGQKSLVFETGRMAKQSHGSVVVRYGDTMVLVTACASSSAKVGQDFFPLSCEYQERSYAGGKIPGGYFKREGKQTEKETLTSRLIDRPLRPMFPDGYFKEVQVVATVLSADKENNADVLAMNGASAAIMLAGLPFVSPVASARIGEIDGQFVLNPTFAQLQNSTMEVMLSVTNQGIIMIEAGANIVPEERIAQALEFGIRELKPVLKLQEQMKKDCGRRIPEEALDLVPDEILQQVRDLAAKEIDRVNKNEKTKESRDEALKALKKSIIEKLVVAGGTVTELHIKRAFEEIEYDEVRRFIIDGKVRTDGRKYNEIRQITVETGVLPRVHGSSLFTRGQTQSLGVMTLGTSRDEQFIDSIDGDANKAFMLHYNFPPFSVGEIKPMRGPGRREIGHGALAERSLRPVVPGKDKFPYTIRLVSDILESNGSSSMASVCSGSLAMMDGGVPVKAPVAGIAMGLVKMGDKYAVLSDIAGVEDHLGDMDFKVAGTTEGVTAIQLDLKLKESISINTLREALKQAHEGRMHILKKMTDVLSQPKDQLSDFAPRITTVSVDPEKIREIIGPGGKMIRKITAESGAQIEVEDDGTVRIAASDGEATKRAIAMIKGITDDAEVGKIYDGTVMRLMNFGAFVEILPGKEGLVHISELDEKRVETVESVVKVGDKIKVKVIEIDSQGRINLSKKQSNSDAPPIVRSRERENGKTFNKKRSWN
jgi:polyribonucleotide nucleotidyltransferase